MVLRKEPQLIFPQVAPELITAQVRQKKLQSWQFHAIPVDNYAGSPSTNPSHSAKIGYQANPACPRGAVSRRPVHEECLADQLILGNSAQLILVPQWNQMTPGVVPQP